MTPGTYYVLLLLSKLLPTVAVTELRSEPAVVRPSTSGQTECNVVECRGGVVVLAGTLVVVLANPGLGAQLDRISLPVVAFCTRVSARIKPLNSPIHL